MNDDLGSISTSLKKTYEEGLGEGVRMAESHAQDVTESKYAAHTIFWSLFDQPETILTIAQHFDKRDMPFPQPFFSHSNFPTMNNLGNELFLLLKKHYPHWLMRQQTCERRKIGWVLVNNAYEVQNKYGELPPYVPPTTLPDSPHPLRDKIEREAFRDLQVALADYILDEARKTQEASGKDVMKEIKAANFLLSNYPVTTSFDELVKKAPKRRGRPKKKNKK